MKKMSILVTLITLLLTASAIAGGGKVQNIVIRSAEPGVKFTLVGQSQYYVIKTATVGENKLDRMLSLLLTSKVKGYKVGFGDDNNNVTWISLEGTY